MKKLILAVLSIGGLAAVGTYAYKRSDLKLKEKDKKVQKFKNYYNMTNQWLQIRNQGRSLEEFFQKNGMNTIAVYGMGELGNRLYEELEKSSITVAYTIDKEADKKYSTVKVVGMEEEFDQADAIIVTPIFDYDEIKASLESKTEMKIISLEEVIYGCI